MKVMLSSLMVWITLISGCTSEKSTPVSQKKTQAAFQEIVPKKIITQLFSEEISSESGQLIVENSEDLVKTSEAFQSLIDAKDATTLVQLAYNLKLSDEIRQMAVWALGQIKPFQIEAHLSLLDMLIVRLIKDDKIKDSALWSLMHYIGYNFRQASDQEIDRLMPFLTQVNIIYLRNSLFVVKALGPQAKKAIPILLGLLEREVGNSDLEILNNIQSTLSAMGPAVIEPTLTHFKQTSEKRVRLRLLRVWLELKSKVAYPVVKEYILSNQAFSDEKEHFTYIGVALEYISKYGKPDTSLIEPLLTLVMQGVNDYSVEQAIKSIMEEADFDRLKQVALDRKQVSDLRAVALNVIKSYEGEEDEVFKVVQNILLSADEADKPLKSEASHVLSSLSFKQDRAVLNALLSHSENQHIPKVHLIETHCFSYNVQHYMDVAPKPFAKTLLDLLVAPTSSRELVDVAIECLAQLSRKFPNDLVSEIIGATRANQDLLVAIVRELGVVSVFGMLPLLEGMNKMTLNLDIPISSAFQEMAMPLPIVEKLLKSVQNSTSHQNVKASVSGALEALSESVISDHIKTFLEDPKSEDKRKALSRYAPSIRLNEQLLEQLLSKWKIAKSNNADYMTLAAYKTLFVHIARTRSNLITYLETVLTEWEEDLYKDGLAYLNILKTQQTWLVQQLAPLAFVKDGYMTPEYDVLERAGEAATTLALSSVRDPSSAKDTILSALGFLTERSLSEDQLKGLSDLIVTHQDRDVKRAVSFVLQSADRRGVELFSNILSSEGVLTRYTAMAALKNKKEEYGVEEDLKSTIDRMASTLRESEENLWILRLTDYCLNGDPAVVIQGG